MENDEKMTEEKFKKLPIEEQRHLSSEYRKTVHDGEIVFEDDPTARSLTPEEADEKLQKKMEEALAALREAMGDSDEDTPRLGK